MRTIKFRAWHEEEGIMFGWNDLRSNGIGDALTGGYSLIPLQYTGLKDKNGVEIYEGDIVREYTGFSDEGGDYLVEYQHNGFWLKGRDNEFGFGDEAEMEVIGNIYENPELLAPKPTKEQE